MLLFQVNDFSRNFVNEWVYTSPSLVTLYETKQKEVEISAVLLPITDAKNQTKKTSKTERMRAWSAYNLTSRFFRQQYQVETFQMQILRVRNETEQETLVSFKAQSLEPYYRVKNTAELAPGGIFDFISNCCDERGVKNECALMNEYFSSFTCVQIHGPNTLFEWPGEQDRLNHLLFLRWRFKQLRENDVCLEESLGAHCSVGSLKDQRSFIVTHFCNMEWEKAKWGSDLIRSYYSKIYLKSTTNDSSGGVEDLDTFLRGTG